MPNTMYQVSTLQALMMGDYEGHISIRALLKKGDTGLGTFDSLHGEMILLDGICYRALEDGHVEVSQEEDRSPFAVTSFLKEDAAFPISAPDFSALQQALDARRIRLGKNNICLCRIDGDFKEIKARSEVPQTRPYRPLAVAMKTDQREFTFEHVSGSLVCVYFPPYMDKLNMAGWHIHFISKDRRHGGHVFGLSLTKGSAHLASLPSFELAIPQEFDFQHLDPTVSKEDIEAVEGKKA